MAVANFTGETFVQKFPLVIEEAAERGQPAETARAAGGRALIEQQRGAARASGADRSGDARRAAAHDGDVHRGAHGSSSRARRPAANSAASASEK